MQRSGRFIEAERIYRALLKLNPTEFGLLYRLGVLCLTDARPQEAVKWFDRAIARNRRSSDAHYGRAVALEELGDLAAARGAYERAVDLSPSNGLAHRGLADCTRYAAGHPHLARMEALARDLDALPHIDRVHLYAALTKAYDDLQDYRQAARHMLDGNRMQRQQILYDEAVTLGQIDRVSAVFTSQLMAEKKGFGAASATPVFVVGMPRSGSTLIEQILASHPKVHGAGEIHDFGNSVASLGCGHFSSDTFLGQVPSMSAAQFQQIGAQYLRSTRALAQGNDRVVNKLPGNFIALGLIHLALPGAIIVHSRRNAIDTCLSRFSKIFVPGQAYSYDLGELGRYHRAYERLMTHWRRVVPANALIEVDYEAVVTDLEGEARRLIAFCGLEWDDACLAFHKTRRSVTTPSKSQVRQPLYASAVGRWRPYQEMLQPLLQALDT